MTPPPPTRPQSLARRLVLLLAGGVAAVAAVSLAGRANAIEVPVDYHQFWSAGWLTLRGENPYDPVRMFEVQKPAGLKDQFAALSWHPPWTLVLTLPFGLLPVPAGWLVWSAVQLAAVTAAANLLWRGFGGPERLQWLAVGLAAGFAPTVMLVGAGQITGLCLLGTAGFVAGMRAGRPGLAGVALALTAVKPHLFALLGLVLLLEAIRSRPARVAVLTGTVTLAVAALLVAAINPDVFSYYLDAVTGRAGAGPYRVQDIPSPTVGWFLRSAVAPESRAVGLLPLAGLAVGTVAWWATRRSPVDWPRAVPWLVLGSLLGTPYGAFAYDLVVLLVPVLAVAARLAVEPTAPVTRFLATGWYAVVTGVLFVCLANGKRMAITDYVFVTPLVAAAVVTVVWMTPYRRPAAAPIL